MHAPNPAPAPRRETFADALRFWERSRIAYNLVLVAVVLAWVIFTWPHFRPAFRLWTLVPLLVLALLANLCYCAVYLVDTPLRRSAMAAAWARRRWILWLFGTLLAFLFANYWIADEIYPYVR